MKTIAFFNNKGGVGKTSLVYHLAWMYADQGLRVLVADLDPQANLSAMFLDDTRLLALWDDGEKSTVTDSLRPLMDRTGDIAAPHVEPVGRNIGLIPGNLALSRFEDLLSENWPKCLDGQEAAFRVITAFHRIMVQAARAMQVDLTLIDVGPNLGAINRSALIAAEQVVLPDDLVEGDRAHARGQWLSGAHAGAPSEPGVRRSPIGAVCSGAVGAR